MVVSAGEHDPEGQVRIVGLREGLSRLGWVEGRNLQLTVRFGAGDPGRIRGFVRTLLADAPDLIVVNRTPALDEAYKAASNVPVVFMMAIDPVGLGYIKSLARPGGTITGFTFWDVSLIGKWLQLLKEAVPTTKRATFIHNPINTPYYKSILLSAADLAASHGIALDRVELREPQDIEPAIREVAREPGASLVAASDPFLVQNRKSVVAAALAARLPLISIFRVYAEDGALMAYGPDTGTIYRDSASYVDRILRGARPSDLPAQEPTKYEFVVNAGTATKLDLTLSPSLLARADQVIE